MGIIPNHYISVYSGTDKATQKNLTNEESTNLFIYGSPVSMHIAIYYFEVNTLSSTVLPLTT